MTHQHAVMLAAVLAAAAPLAVTAGQSIDERRDLAADGKLTVINVSGDISVTAWDRNEVHLTGDLGEGAELDIDASSGAVRIEVRKRGGKSSSGHMQASDLELRAPAGAVLEIRGVSSDIEILGARGDSVTAETVSGDVEVEAQTARLELRSVSGDVSFSGASARTTVETVSGDITLSGVSGELDVTVVSGDVEVKAGELNRGRFEAVSGTLELGLSLARGASVKAEGMSADVEVTIPAGQDVEIRAQTFSGSIRSAFGSPQKVANGPGRQLEHVAGSGGASLRLETFSGDVEISKQ